MRDRLSYGGGWQPDVPDHRDYCIGHPLVRQMLAAAELHSEVVGEAASQAIDLRGDCPEPLVGGAPLGSAAWAGWCLFEYFHRRSFGHRGRTSPWFIDRVTRRLCGQGETAGLSLREVFKAMCRCGMPPLALDNDAVERCEALSPLLFLYHRHVEQLRYVRLDDPQAAAPELLARIKCFLRAGFAVALGMSRFGDAIGSAEIAAPTVYDRLQCTEAVVVVGFDDERTIRSTRGALLVHVCPTPDARPWHFQWLSYRYILERYARDVWTLLRPQWLRSGEFALAELPGDLTSR